jgi:hypothetical protein
LALLDLAAHLKKKLKILEFVTNAKRFNALIFVPLPLNQYYNILTIQFLKKYFIICSLELFYVCSHARF